MPRFSRKSKDALATCDERIQVVLNEAIKHVDFTVVWGYRNEEQQNRALASDNSTKAYPNSKHNKRPSQAVDIAPYFPGVGIDWDETYAFCRLIGYIERIADEMGIQLRWGGDWNDNYRTNDERLKDLGHLELVDA